MGWDFTITDPDGLSAPFVGRSSDISQIIDQDTGQVVSGRFAHISVCIADLTDAGMAVPVGIADGAVKPWLVDVADVAGVTARFKVMESNPDRALGNVICMLEAYV